MRLLDLVPQSQHGPLKTMTFSHKGSDGFCMIDNDHFCAAGRLIQSAARGRNLNIDLLKVPDAYFAFNQILKIAHAEHAVVLQNFLLVEALEARIVDLTEANDRGEFGKPGALYDFLAVNFY